MEAPRPKTAARVLVVEDDEHIRELVMLHLQLEGHTVGVDDRRERKPSGSPGTDPFG